MSQIEKNTLVNYTPPTKDLKQVAGTTNPDMSILTKLKNLERKGKDRIHSEMPKPSPRTAAHALSHRRTSSVDTPRGKDNLTASSADAEKVSDSSEGRHSPRWITGEPGTASDPLSGEGLRADSAGEIDGSQAQNNNVDPLQQKKDMLKDVNKPENMRHLLDNSPGKGVVGRATSIAGGLFKLIENKPPYSLRDLKNAEITELLIKTQPKAWWEHFFEAVTDSDGALIESRLDSCLLDFRILLRHTLPNEQAHTLLRESSSYAVKFSKLVFNAYGRHTLQKALNQTVGQIVRDGDYVVGNEAKLRKNQDRIDALGESIRKANSSTREQLLPEWRDLKKERDALIVNGKPMLIAKQAAVAGKAFKALMVKLTDFQPCAELKEHYRALCAEVDFNKKFDSRTALVNVFTLYHLGPLFDQASKAYPASDARFETTSTVMKLVQFIASHHKVKTREAFEAAMNAKPIANSAYTVAREDVYPAVKQFDKLLVGKLVGCAP